MRAHNPKHHPLKSLPALAAVLPYRTPINMHRWSVKRGAFVIVTQHPYRPCCSLKIGTSACGDDMQLGCNVQCPALETFVKFVNSARQVLQHTIAQIRYVASCATAATPTGTKAGARRQSSTKITSGRRLECERADGLFSILSRAFPVILCANSPQHARIGDTVALLRSVHLKQVTYTRPASTRQKMDQYRFTLPTDTRSKNLFKSYGTLCPPWRRHQNT